MSYIGFIAPKKNIDYSELSQGILDVFQGIKDERLKTQAELTRQYEDVKATVNAIEMGKSPSANELLLDGSTKAKENIYNAARALKSGEMSPLEFRNFMNSTKSSFSSMTNAIKDFDARYQEQMNRQQADDNGFTPASQIEMDIFGYVADMTELSGAEMYQDPTSGNFYMVKRDSEGKIVNTIDFNVLNKPGNIVFNRVDLNSSVKAIKETAEKDKKFRREGTRIVTTEGVPVKEGYDKFKRSQAVAVASNDRAVASILVDYGYQETNEKGDITRDIKYITYFDSPTYNDKDQVIAMEINAKEKVDNKKMSEEDRKEFIKDLEKRMIRLYQDGSGAWQPEITEEMEQKAIDIVSDRIDMSFGISETSTTGTTYTGSSKKGNSGIASKDYPLVQEVADAWVGKDMGTLTNLTKGKYKFNWSGSTLNVIDDSTGEKIDEIVNAKIDDIGQYIGVNNRTWTNDVNKWRKAGGKAGGGSTSTTKLNGQD